MEVPNRILLILRNAYRFIRCQCIHCSSFMPALVTGLIYGAYVARGEGWGKGAITLLLDHHFPSTR